MGRISLVSLIYDMPVVKITNLGGKNTYLNPLIKDDGELLHSVNVESYPFGAKRKRGGYSTFLGTADGSSVTTLFSWTKNNGDLFVYRTSGDKVYYSIEGTGSWTVAGNGTISAGESVGHAVLDDVLIIGDGAGSTRHTANGTSFTNTTLAPPGKYFTQYGNRVYIGGTSSTVFYSTAGSASDWQTSAPGNSSSFTAPGEGKINSVFTAGDRVIASKTSGNMMRYDGDTVIDLATEMGPSSHKSIGHVEGYYFYLNRYGITGYGGERPELLSNAIQPQIYNDAGSAIAGTVFSTAPGCVHYYDYLCSVGDVTDDITGITVNDCILKYDFKKDEFLNYKFAHKPTAMHSFVNASGVRKMIFGTNSGQVYQLDGSSDSDSGSAIESQMVYMLHFGDPFIHKKFNIFRAIFSPGCQANIQIAISDSLYDMKNLLWVDLGDAQTGEVRYRFPQGSSGKILYVRISDSGSTSRYTFYGFAVDLEADGIA